MKQFHIVWFTNIEGVTTGKNYEALNEISALIYWREEHPKEDFAVMYTSEIAGIARVERGNIHLD